MLKITGRRGRYVIVREFRSWSETVAVFRHRWQAEAYVLMREVA